LDETFDKGKLDIYEYKKLTIGASKMILDSLASVDNLQFQVDVLRMLSKTLNCKLGKFLALGCWLIIL
jgi:hypothetical protein